MPLCPNFDFASAVLPRNLRVLCGAAASAIRPETLFYHFMPLSRLLSVALLSIAISHPAVSQVNQPKASYFEAGQLKSFYTTYVYTAYTVHDITSDEPPTPVRGVGGTLTLHPDGRYQKRLTIQMNQGLIPFHQDGQFTIKGDSIRFAFTDRKGPDVQQGTFRFIPETQALEITIIGYPSGNKGVYELRGQALKPTQPARK